MINRNLTRRLEELEARLAPAAEPMIFQITYVSPDGSEEDGSRFIIPGAGGRPTGSAGLAGGGWPRFASRQYREDREDLHP
jgi:hypothetical protein